MPTVAGVMGKHGTEVRHVPLMGADYALCFTGALIRKGKFVYGFATSFFVCCC